MESRITDLEIKISYTEDLLDELNRIVFRQQQQIDLLAKEIRSLCEQSQNANRATCATNFRRTTEHAANTRYGYLPRRLSGWLWRCLRGVGSLW